MTRFLEGRLKALCQMAEFRIDLIDQLMGVKAGSEANFQRPGRIRRHNQRRLCNFYNHQRLRKLSFLLD